jgi:hypothetical protein
MDNTRFFGKDVRTQHRGSHKSLRRSMGPYFLVFRGDTHKDNTWKKFTRTWGFT